MCLTTVILAPGASEGGLGAAVFAPLPSNNGDVAGSRGQVPGGHFLCAGIVLESNESHLLGIGRPILSKTCYIGLGRPRRPPWQPKATQSGPRAAQGTQKDPKVVPEVKRQSEEGPQAPDPAAFGPWSLVPDPYPFWLNICASRAINRQSIGNI